MTNETIKGIAECAVQANVSRERDHLFAAINRLLLLAGLDKEERAAVIKELETSLWTRRAELLFSVEPPSA